MRRQEGLRRIFRRRSVLRARRPGSGDRGFTLIETLVVLIIVAAVGAIVVNSYQRILDIRLRLAAFLDGTDAPTLIAGWFRNSVEGLVAEQPGQPGVFAGTPRRLSGLSVAAIDGPAGVPMRIVWELVYDPAAGRTALRYRRADREALTVASWPGDRGALRYCTERLVCSQSWPPAQGSASELPALIVLDAVRGTEEWPIAAAPQSDREPPPKIENPLRAL